MSWEALKVHNYSTGGNEYIQNLSGVSLNVIFSLSVYSPPATHYFFCIFVFFTGVTMGYKKKEKKKGLKKQANLKSFLH